jgi:putative cell wall-binding protein
MVRLRRAAVTLTLGIGAIGGVIAGASGVAAASVADAGTIAASSAPSIAATGTNQAAGSLTLTISTPADAPSGDYIDVIATNTGSDSGSAAVCFSALPTVSSAGVSVETVGLTDSPASTCNNTVQIQITSTPVQGATITLSNVAYNTSNATGTLDVYGVVDSSASDLPPGTTTGDEIAVFAPASGVSNATLPAAPPGLPSTATLAAVMPVPNLAIGKSNQAAANWNLTVSGTSTSSSPSGWASGDDFVITVGPSTSCTTYFATTPSVSVTTSSGVSVAPTVSATLASTTPCGSLTPNVVDVSFTNSGTFSTSGGTFTISITNVQYDVNSNASTGSVPVAATYDVGGTASSLTVTTTNASNGTISTVFVQADNPPVTASPNAIDVAISPVSIVENAADQVAPGYVCITFDSGTVDTSVTPKASVTSGNGQVSSAPVTFAQSSGYTAGDNSIIFDVTAPSTTPTTYQVSGIAVNAPSSGGPVTVEADAATSATACPKVGTSTYGAATAYTVESAVTTIYGSDANATAAAELETAYPHNPDGVVGSTTCPGGKVGTTGLGAPNVVRPVVLATSQNFPDALAASYFAGRLGTGILLTDTDSLSSSALNALRLEGITTVYVVGGPLAVSSAVVQQLQSTPSYTCGGSTVRTNAVTGAVQDLQVIQTEGQTYGQTEYGTAADLAQYFGSSGIGSLNIGAAYGMYNDTTPQGTESSGPSTSGPLSTAILATGENFPDAMSAAGLAYAEHLPVLLTETDSLAPEAASAITNLGIKQVIVVGGPLAVSDSVVSSLTSMGVSVLRIAGQDYTATAVELADFEANTTVVNGAAEGLGTSTSGASEAYDAVKTVAVARGDFFTDALAGSVITGGVSDGVQSTPIPQLLTENPSTVGQYLTTFLNQAGTVGINSQGTSFKVTGLDVFGGPLAVQPSTISQMESDLNG